MKLDRWGDSLPALPWLQEQTCVRIVRQAQALLVPRQSAGANVLHQTRHPLQLRLPHGADACGPEYGAAAQ